MGGKRECRRSIGEEKSSILEKTYGEQEPVCKAGRSGLWDLHGDHLFHQRKKHKHELERVSKQAQKHQRTSQV